MKRRFLRWLVMKTTPIGQVPTWWVRYIYYIVNPPSLFYLTITHRYDFLTNSFIFGNVKVPVDIIQWIIRTEQEKRDFVWKFTIENGYLRVTQIRK